MADIYANKLFEFSNIFDNGNEWINNVRIIQIGETCLDKGASIREHIQTCNEITLLISGTGTVTADQEENKCGVGDIQIISKGIKHNITSDTNTPLRYIHFAFDFNDGAPETLSAFYGQCKNVILHDDGSIKWLLNLLVEEYANDAEFKNIMKNSLVYAVLVLIWRRVNTHTDQLPVFASKNPIGNTVYNIIKYIDRHADGKLTVNEIADKFSYSKEYISKLFKEKTGYSLKKYIIAMKMKYAQTLLSEKKCSLEEITDIMGYSSTQAFCKAFKKYTGYTPGQFAENAVNISPFIGIPIDD